MSDWKKIRLCDVINDIAAGPFGSNLPKSCFTESGFPIIDGANLKEIRVTDNITKFVTEEKARTLGRAIAKRGDVIVTISGTVGQISFIPESSKYSEYLVSQRQFRCTFNTKLVDVPYIVYYFHSYEGRNKILQFANQVGVPALSQPLKNFRNIQLELPPLAEQKKIAGILSALDEKIETNRKINARLEQLAQAIFKSRFIDFEPFGGKMPQDWKVCNLGDLTVECKEKVKNLQNVSVLSPISTGELVLSEEFFTKQVFSQNLSKYLIVKPKSFAYNPARVNIGSIGINNFDFVGCVSPVYVVFKAIDGYTEYINNFIKTQNFKEEVLLRAIGGVRQTLNYMDFSLIQVVKPSLSFVKNFEDILTPICSQISHFGKESARLAELRDTLLPKLMSGELKPV